MTSLSQEVQNEVLRIRDEIATTKALLPKGRANFVLYEMTLDEAERAVREQDAVALVRILPELHGM